MSRYSFANVRDLVGSIEKLLEHPEEAEQFLSEYVDYMTENNQHGWDAAESRRVCLKNIGYAAGYIDTGAIEKVSNLIPGAIHPIYIS